MHLCHNIVLPAFLSLSLYYTPSLSKGEQRIHAKITEGMINISQDLAFVPLALYASVICELPPQFVVMKLIIYSESITGRLRPGEEIGRITAIGRLTGGRLITGTDCANEGVRCVCVWGGGGGCSVWLHRLEKSNDNILSRCDCPICLNRIYLC